MTGVDQALLIGFTLGLWLGASVFLLIGIWLGRKQKQ